MDEAGVYFEGGGDPKNNKALIDAEKASALMVVETDRWMAACPSAARFFATLSVLK